MKLALALSGETPPSDLLSDFDHIGLIRSEYLFRHAELYPTRENARPVLLDYLRTICARTGERPVWFRTLEVTTREANTLAGVEEVIWDEPVPMMGLRGIRRAMKHPASLQAELEVIAEVRRTYPNLGVVAPLIADEAEFAWFRDQVHRHIGPETPTASMVETPAAVMVLESILAAGADHVIVGTNDLSAFLLARSRTPTAVTEVSPALLAALTRVREMTMAAETTMTVAGYLTPDLIAGAERVGADFAAVHYCDLPRLYGARYGDLPEAGRVYAVKRRTRAAISRLEENRAHAVSMS